MTEIHLEAPCREGSLALRLQGPPGQRLPLAFECEPHRHLAVLDRSDHLLRPGAHLGLVASPGHARTDTRGRSGELVDGGRVETGPGRPLVEALEACDEGINLGRGGIDDRAPLDVHAGGQEQESDDDEHGDERECRDEKSLQDLHELAPGAWRPGPVSCRGRGCGGSWAPARRGGRRRPRIVRRRGGTDSAPAVPAVPRGRPACRPGTGTRE